MAARFHGLHTGYIRRPSIKLLSRRTMRNIYFEGVHQFEVILDPQWIFAV